MRPIVTKSCFIFLTRNWKSRILLYLCLSIFKIFLIFVIQITNYNKNNPNLQKKHYETNWNTSVDFQLVTFWLMKQSKLFSKTSKTLHNLGCTYFSLYTSRSPHTKHTVLSGICSPFSCWKSLLKFCNAPFPSLNFIPPWDSMSVNHYIKHFICSRES